MTKFQQFVSLWPVLVVLVASCHTQNLDSKIDSLFAPYTGDVPGAAMMVIHNGKIRMLKTYGLANLETKEPITVSSNFRLASFTKQFTAMAIMMLEEQGALTFDTKLSDIFSEFPEYGKRISIEQLLHHTSGLLAYESLMDSTDTTQVLDDDVLKMMMSLDSTYFEPGTKYRYSNSAYAVLARVVEKRSGQPFSRFLATHIFDRLNMNTTVAYEQGISVVLNRTYGYAVNADSFRFRDQSPTSAVLGDGGIYSNLLDLFLWDQALYGDSLVTKQNWQRATTSGRLADGTETGYGYGWRLDSYRGHQRMHHTGGTCGFATVIQRYPDDQFSVVILTNRNEPPVAEIADRLTDLLLLD